MVGVVIVDEQCQFVLYSVLKEKTSGKIETIEATLVDPVVN